MLMRISGKHNVKNAEYYNELIALISQYSKLDPDIVESLLFQKQLKKKLNIKKLKMKLTRDIIAF